MRHARITATAAAACLGLGTMFAAPAAAADEGDGADAVDSLFGASLDLLPSDSLIGGGAGGDDDGEGDGTESCEDTNSDQRDVISDPPEKSWEDALAKARDEFDGEVTKIELEQSSKADSGLEYKIEQYTDTEKFAEQYDADDLETIDDKLEDSDTGTDKSFDPDEVVPVEEAAATACGKVSGSIAEWKIEGKTDRVQYEFDIYPPDASDDTEVKVDAESGDLIDD